MTNMTFNRYAAPLVVCLATLAVWGCTSSAADSSGSSPAVDGTVWREAAAGLSIGITISEENANAASPVLDVYFKNHGSNEISGVIQSPSRFIVELNGEFFATMDRGGKGSYMLPGGMYGPLRVDTSKYWKIPKVDAIYTIQPNESHPVMKMEKNTLRLHYKIFGKTGVVLVPTAEIIIRK